jgi:hypothetical protein
VTSNVRAVPIDVAMGAVNVIWPGDANAAIRQSLTSCVRLPAILNASGPETAAIRWLATELARLLDAPAPVFAGEEARTALLSTCSRYHALFGYPRLPLGRLLAWTAHWVRQGGRTLDKPTHFETRDGRFDQVPCRPHPPEPASLSTTGAAVARTYSSANSGVPSSGHTVRRAPRAWAGWLPAWKSAQHCAMLV